MPEKQDTFKSLCVPEHLVRRTWYGDVYSARVTHEGLPKTCHLTHIQIPLPEEKLSAAAEMFGLEEDDQDTFSAWFLSRIQNHVRTMLYLKENNVNNMVELWHADLFENEGAKHIYVMTPPYETYAETLEGKSLSVSELYGALVRISSLIRDIGAVGLSHGDISLSSLYITEEDKIVLGDFYYTAPLNSAPNPDRYKFILPPHVREEDAVSGEVKANADLQGLCSLMWTMVNEIPADIRTPYRTTLQKAPEDLSALLFATLGNEEAQLDSFRKSASSMLRAANKASESYAGITFSVPPSRMIYEPAPAAPIIDTGVSESSLLDAIAPIPGGQAADSAAE